MRFFGGSPKHARRSSRRPQVLVTGLAAIMGLIALCAGLAFGLLGRHLQLQPGGGVGHKPVGAERQRG